MRRATISSNEITKAWWPWHAAFYGYQCETSTGPNIREVEREKDGQILRNKRVILRPAQPKA
ncbi:hypothetical protein GCM10027172_25500 [Halomonas garicola]